MEKNHSRITIEDIAAQANVSISTVSRVLNNSAPVRSSTREAVLEAAASLNYRPNIFAQSLASGQSMTIGVLTQHISSPLYDAMLQGILLELDQSDYTALFADGYWEEARERQMVAALLERQVDGLIVLGGNLANDSLKELDEQVPLVVFGREVPGMEERCLTIDNYGGAYRAMRHLIELGHRQIAHITGVMTHNDSQARYEGYRQALADAQIPFDENLVIEGDYTEPAGSMAVEMLFTRGHRFSAVFAANDQMAYGVRLALFRRGLRVPADVSIVGFDDIPHSSYTTPPLTTVRQPADKVGQAVARAILQRLKGEPVPLAPLPAPLMVRESTGRLR